MSEDKNLGNSELNAADELTNAPQEQPVEYTDDNIRHLSDMEHVRTRPVCTSVVWEMEICRKMVFMCS